MKKITEGDKAWIGLAGYVVAYDAWAMITGRETLTSSFYRALDSPIRRWPTVMAWGYLTGHLFGAIPRRYDLMARMGEIAESIRGRTS